MARFLREVEQPFDKRHQIKRRKKMKRVFATLAIAVFAAWAAPASAGVIFSDDGEDLRQSNPFFEFVINLEGFFDVMLSFDTDGKGNEECGTNGVDCLTVSVNGNPVLGLEDISIPRPEASFGPILLGADDQLITLRFESAFSASHERFVFSNIKLFVIPNIGVTNTTVSEPAPLALFGLGLAGLGYVRRRRSA